MFPLFLGWALWRPTLVCVQRKEKATTKHQGRAHSFSLAEVKELHKCWHVTKIHRDGFQLHWVKYRNPWDVVCEAFRFLRVLWKGVFPRSISHTTNREHVGWNDSIQWRNILFIPGAMCSWLCQWEEMAQTIICRMVLARSNKQKMVRGESQINNWYLVLSCLQLTQPELWVCCLLTSKRRKRNSCDDPSCLKSRILSRPQYCGATAFTKVQHLRLYGNQSPRTEKQIPEQISSRSGSFQLFVSGINWDLVCRKKVSVCKSNFVCFSLSVNQVRSRLFCKQRVFSPSASSDNGRKTGRPAKWTEMKGSLSMCAQSIGCARWVKILLLDRSF